MRVAVRLVLDRPLWAGVTPESRIPADASWVQGDLKEMNLCWLQYRHLGDLTTEPLCVHIAAHDIGVLILTLEDARTQRPGMTYPRSWNHGGRDTSGTLTFWWNLYIITWCCLLLQGAVIREALDTEKDLPYTLQHTCPSWSSLHMEPNKFLNRHWTKMQVLLAVETHWLNFQRTRWRSSNHSWKQHLNHPPIHQPIYPSYHLSIYLPTYLPTREVRREPYNLDGGKGTMALRLVVGQSEDRGRRERT